jgi:hypothetical protein
VNKYWGDNIQPKFEHEYLIWKYSGNVKIRIVEDLKRYKFFNYALFYLNMGVDYVRFFDNRENVYYFTEFVNNDSVRSSRVYKETRVGYVLHLTPELFYNLGNNASIEFGIGINYTYGKNVVSLGEDTYTKTQTRITRTGYGYGFSYQVQAAYEHQLKKNTFLNFSLKYCGIHLHYHSRGTSFSLVPDGGVIAFSDMPGDGYDTYSGINANIGLTYYFMKKEK